MLVEKRVAGIIRWLERLKKSYSSGAMESALMDAECARADLENLRRYVWAKLGPSSRPNSAVTSLVLSSAKTLSLAMIIVMMSVMPLSRDVNVPVPEIIMTEIEREKPTIIIRATAPAKPDTPAQTARIQPKKPTVPKRPTTKRIPSASPSGKTHPPARNTVPYDKVYSLIQTGQRALKNNSSVIKLK